MLGVEPLFIERFFCSAIEQLHMKMLMEKFVGLSNLDELYSALFFLWNLGVGRKQCTVGFDVSTRLSLLVYRRSARDQLGVRLYSAVTFFYVICYY